MQPVLELEATVYTLEQMRAFDAPQIALAGRSNVGKSSLVNALARRKALAKISATPGKTRSINYYRVKPDGFYVVDLPGYGYAKCSKEERQKWAELIERYLSTCPTLKALTVLLDSRLEPQQLDLDLTSFARKNGITLLPVLTKADKCSQRERAERQRQWRDILGGIAPLVVSAKTGMGVDNLWASLRKVVTVGEVRGSALLDPFGSAKRDVPLADAAPRDGSKVDPKADFRGTPDATSEGAAPSPDSEPGANGA
uniref:Probable GTP-binding protein EngB n=1 Tax=Nitratidesulfovibrio vulgaris (strain DSM 19637 / Miyazaki F) TaxID=883 RepID=B8DJK9_NITV9